MGTNNFLSNRVRINALARSRVLSILNHPRIFEPLKVRTKKCKNEYVRSTNVCTQILKFDQNLKLKINKSHVIYYSDSQ